MSRTDHLYEIRPARRFDNRRFECKTGLLVPHRRSGTDLSNVGATYNKVRNSESPTRLKGVQLGNLPRRLTAWLLDLTEPPLKIRFHAAT